MGIDRLDQAGDILGRSRAGDIDGKGHVLEASWHVRDSEEPAQIDSPLSGHVHTVEWYAEHPGIGRVDDFLARAKSGEDQLDWGGSGVGTTNQRRLVHVERELTDACLRSVLIDQRGSCREGHYGWFRGVAQIRP